MKMLLPASRYLLPSFSPVGLNPLLTGPLERNHPVRLIQKMIASFNSGAFVLKGPNKVGIGHYDSPTVESRASRIILVRLKTRTLVGLTVSDRNASPSPLRSPT